MVSMTVTTRARAYSRKINTAAARGGEWVLLTLQRHLVPRGRIPALTLPQVAAAGGLSTMQ